MQRWETGPLADHFPLQNPNLIASTSNYCQGATYASVQNRARGVTSHLDETDCLTS